MYNERRVVKLIKRNRNLFIGILNKASKSSESQKFALIHEATLFAVDNNIGYWHSSEIENFYLDIAKKNKIQVKCLEPKTRSILHIATETYDFGGHTRVIERWISNAPDSETHSLLVTNYGDRGYPITNSFGSIVAKKKGNIYSLSSEKLISRGLKMRNIASGYEKVILHINPWDPIPLIAFGTNDFKRPIILYNHASHVFWLGLSIADLVADICSKSEKKTKKRRFVNSFNIGIPINLKKNKCDESLVRKKLNLPLNKKIILSSGPDYKYKPYGDLNFIEIFKPILEADSQIILLIIGVDNTNSYWKEAALEIDGRLITMDTVDNDKFNDYINSADLIVESIPIPSGTTLIDAVNFGKPILSLDKIWTFDYLLHSPAYCKNIEEFQKKTIEILNSEAIKLNHINLTKNSLYKFNSNKVWLKNIQKLYELTPKSHTVRSFNSKIKKGEIYTDDILIAYTFNRIIEKNEASKFDYMIFFKKYINLFLSKVKKFFKNM